ncbi:ergothioneine biosynthesis protein EgtB [Pedobacter sp. SYSU D00535]|uniref:ergothioneine biosynthesis protein EgtB n=1 Tax=Pedobacter sp. SYSU D00535 TaxID=2810308 RepID=UPI001A960B0A|nr:ergothioneine biosynthesis protein EgtB [Pedobacter sp. SYSU D00535]
MFLNRYLEIRSRSEEICRPLKTEDYVVQPVVDVSPPKWHLGHTTWFFETFLLKPHHPHYKEFNPDYNFVFNSYYETVGARVIRTDRGNLSRPTVEEVYQYRNYVDEAMVLFLQRENFSPPLMEVILLGLNHEQQHQELLMTDIKYILGHNPLFPAYNQNIPEEESEASLQDWIDMPEGLYQIGHSGDGFCFDNELGKHHVFLGEYMLSNRLVSNQEYLEFIEAGGYENFRLWHSEGWDWAKSSKRSPLYWHKQDGDWYEYGLQGLKKLNPEKPVCHVNFYEAHAFALWKGKRLPTEFEWEAAANKFDWGKRWEWTESAYLPYPKFKTAEGAIGEYNGKFMVNQMVLRGASEATPTGHSRASYRNFFPPHLQWQFSGIRLAQ